MKLGIMQPYFFPYIGYWQLMNTVDKYVIYDDVNFIKGGWINRNRILMNGEAKLFNLKMDGASPNKLINQINVSGDLIYRNKLLKTIELAYKKAPYFSDVLPIIDGILMQEDKNMARFLEFSIREICKYLLIGTDIIVSSDINKDNGLKGQKKVIEICKRLGADEYYNAIGGQELYSYEAFNNEGIKLDFLQTDKIQYKQFDKEFIPNLSIIDVMMFNSVEDIRIMLNKFELVQEKII